MVQVGISTQWLLEGFKYELETTVRPKTVEYYTGEIRRFLRWAESAGVPSDIRLITRHHIQAFFHHLITTQSDSSLRNDLGSIERLRWPYYRAVRRFFGYFVRGCMYSDMETAIEGGASTLAALGLSVYTEILGGLVTGKLGEDGQHRQNFEAFLTCYMGKPYRELVIRKEVNIYRLVRCGLVHEYSLKGGAQGVMVVMDEPHDRKCGIFFEDVEEEGNQILCMRFSVPRYFYDFKKGANRYQRQLVAAHDLELIKNFMKGLGRLITPARR